MRRSKGSVVAIVGALVLGTFPAIGSLGATSLATSAVQIADVEEENVIAAGWPSHQEAKQCVYKGSCPGLEGVAYADVDISDAMLDADDGATFHVANTIVSSTTMWLVCSYDGAGTALDCWFDGEPSWGARGELSSDARELRLLPIQSAPNEYHLQLWVH